MTLAINAVRTSRLGGGGMDNYTIHLVNHMAKLGLEFDLWTLTPEHFPQVPQNRILHPLQFLGVKHHIKRAEKVTQNAVKKSGGIKHKIALNLGDSIKMFWTQFVFPFLVILRGYKLIFSLSQMDALPLKLPGCKQVISVLDLIPFVLKDQRNKHLLYLKYFFPLALKSSTHLITISENTKKDLEKIFKVPEKKITSILLARAELGRNDTMPSAQEIKSVLKKFKLSSYLFCVSSNHPHKNVPRLLEAFEAIQGFVEQDLVIAGYKDSADQNIELVAGTKKRVHFLGHVSDADLVALYAGADAFVFPSLYEGFGLPPLEALSFGRAVAVSKTSSLPEVTGQAAVYFDPYNVQEMSQVLLRLLQDQALRQSLMQKSLSQAAQFSWTKTATQTIEVLKQFI